MYKLLKYLAESGPKLVASRALQKAYLYKVKTTKCTDIHMPEKNSTLYNSKYKLVSRYCPLPCGKSTHICTHVSGHMTGASK